MTTYKKITYENSDCAVEYSVKAGQAIKLATARTIGISDADASHSGTGASFDGSADVTVKLPATIKATLVGNADTATSATSAGTATSASEAAKLSTARSIKTDLSSGTGASFDGSADVTPGVSGILPIANGGTGESSVDTTPTSGSAKMVTSGGVYSALQQYARRYTYSMSFNATTFQTDPTACLVYGEDCAGFSPVDNSAQTSLTRADPQSWGSSNPLIDGMYYATFDADHNILHVLDPEDLTKSIDGTDCSTEITTNDVMLCIPTIYTNRNASGISLSSEPSKGVAWAHTYDEKVYNTICIGVYEGYVDANSKLRSISGVVPTRSQTRAQMRTQAQANGGMLTNFHIRQLLRDLAILTTKSFDGQRKIGQGYTSGGSSSNPDGLTTGLGNKLGRYAGNPGGTSNVVKCLIENPWGSKWEFVDDVVTALNGSTYSDLYAGQRLQPDDDATAMNLVTSDLVASYGWATAIKTGSTSWGLANNSSGGDSVGLCDYHWHNTGIQCLCLWGGASSDGSCCGPSCVSLHTGLSTSSWNFGGRLAFVI